MKTAFESLISLKNTFVVGIDDGPEPFLAGSVPDLKFDNFVVDFHGFESEVNTDGDHVILIELVIGESQQ
jgi:hypothetical protein